jgi:hypothetical protein
MAMLREASEEHAAMLRAMLENDDLEGETRAEILTELRKHDELRREGY